jgi:hypothetical protein
MKFKTIKLKITLIEQMLGTKAANKDVFADYIASKAPDDDLRKQELDTAEHREEAGTTVFHRDADGALIMWNYQFKGFLKESANVIRQTMSGDGEEPPEAAAGAAAVKKPRKRGTVWGNAKAKIDNFLFVSPRQIKLFAPGRVVAAKTRPDGVCERPLRAETQQGPRVTVARSEVVDPGTYFICEVSLVEGGPVTEEMVLQCLDYGALKGLGQWRNSGKGAFSYQILD